MLASIPFVIGHRGAAAKAPENTLSALRVAAADGARWVEVDVQLTRDGVPVLFHDDDLDRTTDGGGLLAEIDAEVLARRDAGSWFGPAFLGERVPSLAAAIATAHALGLGMNLELKVADPATARRLATIALAVARRHWPAGMAPPLVSSFDETCLAEAAIAAPDWPRGLLIDGEPGPWAAAADRLAVATLNLDHRFVTPGLIRAAADRGLRVLAFTVNDPEEARALAALGLAAVFTDDPAAILGRDRNRP